MGFSNLEVLQYKITFESLIMTYFDSLALCLLTKYNKVENIEKDSLDSIPWVKIQIIGGKVLLTRASNVLPLHLK